MGVALVGSWARGEARQDSDLDVIVLTDDPARYLDDSNWANEMGIETLADAKSWGAVTERRGATGAGLEVEFGITGRDWARTEPIDPGTNQVLVGGMRILYDPEGLFAALIRASG